MRVPVSFSVLLCALAVTACSGSSSSAPAFSQPPVSAFAEGTCQVVAPDVLEIGRQARALGEGGTVDKAVIAALEKAQTAMRPVVDGAEPAYKPALSRLVVATGLVRLQASLDGYKPETGQDLRASYDGAVAACTGSAPSTTSSPTS